MIRPSPTAALDALPPSTPVPTFTIATRPQIIGALAFTVAMSRRECAFDGGLGVRCDVHAPGHEDTWCDPCRARLAIVR